MLRPLSTGLMNKECFRKCGTFYIVIKVKRVFNCVISCSCRS